MIPGEEQEQVLAQLDLGEPPEELLEWAKENINENPETKCQVLEEFRNIIYGENSSKNFRDLIFFWEKR